MTQDEAKALVGKRATEFVEDGMAVGLGTGSTATMFIRELGKRVAAEKLRIRCAASSDASFRLGQELGLEMHELPELPELDLYIDGADEVGPGLVLIKGGGGAMLREKIVASSAKTFIVVVDSTKVVSHLGKFPLPVEVIRMALPLVQRRLTALGLKPALRAARGTTDAAQTPWITDEGNVILDCSCGEIHDPAQIADEIRDIVGVVEHGLFLNLASLALVAGDDGVTELLP
jgi:ribose 5-phosphate isomerase A